MRTVILVAAVMFASGAASAVQLQCTKDSRTDAMQCVGPTEVKEQNGIRWAPLYTGGPAQMTKTNFTIHTNCGTGVTHLKDKAGVSFAGGDGNETRALRDLRAIMCDAALKPKK